ncbi:hypothetical protein [Acinetobacter faecalis]|uniref:hypothetical protein n=1 Tax=Acinetobacter faecalis TaxID=2665161 RepID=UPI002A90D6A4|nr:hypothetical protein [Acinetobacter faecalis]MDY6450365.1 hypothetical protein [Acinetobacter faecalis]
MNFTKILAATIFSLSAISFNVSAAIINNVDFPAEFVQAKDKTASTDQEQVTASAEANK